jgi:hypothetical protein
MERHIPFSDWFLEVESLLKTIKKCNFDILDYAEDYLFHNLVISKPQPNVYKFQKSADAEQYNSTPASISSISSIPLNPGTYKITTNTSSLSTKLIAYHVIITCTRDRIVKLQVVEDWYQNFSNFEKIIHSVVFHDNDLLVNGNWFKIDSPEAFTHDLIEDDISVLELIDLFENFMKDA